MVAKENRIVHVPSSTFRNELEKCELIKGRIVSGNEFISKKWYYGSRVKEKYHTWFIIFGRNRREEEVKRFKPYKVVYLHQNHGKGCKLYDEDNFITGCKPFVDWLKKFGWIYDDSPEYVKIHYSQQLSTENLLEVKIFR